MKSVLEMYATGNYSIKALADHLNDKGIKSPRGNKIHISTMHNYLRNPFYVGEFQWNGKGYADAKHEHLITRKIYDSNQLILQAHNNYASRKRRHNYLLRGFLYCDACSSRYWAEQHTKKNGTVYDFYFCSQCKGDSYVDIGKIESQVEKLFGKIQLSKEYTQHVMDTAKKLLKEIRSSRGDESKRIQAERTKIAKAMKEVEDDRFIHKTITAESFKRINERYEKQLLEERLSQKQ